MREIRAKYLSGHTEEKMQDTKNSEECSADLAKIIP